MRRREVRVRAGAVGGRALAMLLALAAWPTPGASAASAAGAASAVPLFPDQARQQAQSSLTAAARLQIEEQFPAAALALRQAGQTDPTLLAVAQAAGDQARWAGDYLAAVQAYGGMTRLDPYGSGGYAQLGEALVLLGQPGGKEALSKALEMDDAAAETRLPLARLAQAAGEPERVAAILEALAPEDREQPAVVLARASLALQRGDDEGAARLLAGLSAGSDGAGTLAAAEAWLAHGRCARALPLLQQEAQRQPRAEALRSLGWGLLLCGRAPLHAAGAFSAALQHDVHDDGARVGLAWALLSVSGPTEAEARPLAVSWLEEVLRRDPAHPGALLARAEAHRRNGELPQAEALLTRLPADQPAADEALLLRARLALDREDPYGAVALLRPLSERRSDAPHLRCALVQALLRAGRSGEARDVVADLQRRLPAGHPLRQHAETLLAGARRPR